MSNLRLQWKNFADNYIKTGNALQSAIDAGYKKSYAKSRSADLLARKEIQEYIAERMAELESKKIADQKEVLEYLTKVLRGEIKEEVLIGTGMGEQETIEVDIPIRERTRAAELLGKRYGAFRSDIEKAEIKVKVDKINAEIDKIKGISEEIEDTTELDSMIYGDSDEN